MPAGRMISYTLQGPVHMPACFQPRGYNAVDLDQSREMDGDDGLGLVADPPANVLRIEAKGAGIDVGEYDAGALSHGAGGGADKRQGGRNHLVARANTQRHHAQIERRSATVHPHRFLGALVPAQGLVELVLLGQGKEVASRLGRRANGPHHGLDVILPVDPAHGPEGDRANGEFLVLN